MNLHSVTCFIYLDILIVQTRSVKQKSTFLEGMSEEGNGTPLQCSCLENPMDGGAWWAAVYGVAQSRIRLTRLSSRGNEIFLPLRLEPTGSKFYV